MSEIFSKYAPFYWAKGLPAIPLKVNSQAPFMNEWPKYCHVMPSKEEQELWLRMYQANNIGLPCGRQSGVILIDYDYTDPEVEKVILKVLGYSPWVRIGSKGWARAYKFRADIQSGNIQDAAGKIIVEIKSTGTQMVLPFSMHPKTGKEYTSNNNLWEVMEELGDLPKDVMERMRTALVTSGKVELGAGGGQKAKFKGLAKVPSGTRDMQMTKYAGFLAREILGGRASLMEALNDMTAWFDAKIEVVVGDKIEVSKGHGQIINFLIRDVTGKGRILPQGWDTDLTDDDRKGWGLNFDESHEEWDLQRIVAYIEEAGKYAPTSVERMTMINFILIKLSRSRNLDIISIDKILSVLKADTKITLAGLKKQLARLQSGSIEGVSHTEIAKEVIKDMGEKFGQLAFWNGLIWNWGGSHWEVIEEQEIRSYIQENYGDLTQSKKFSDHKQIVQVIKDILPQGVGTGVRGGVNFANGLLDEQMVLRTHAPEYGMIYTLPFSYKPELSGKCPMFLEFLHHSWGGDVDYTEKMLGIREAISTTLFGTATVYQRAFLLYGVANTGKSVMMKILSAMVPDESRCAIGPEIWGEPYIAAEFARKVLNVCGELDEKKPLNGKMFKEIVDGSEITSRAIYGSPFKFSPRAAHWFASNYLPKSRDVTNGFNRRWLIFQFTRVVKEEEMIRELNAKIIYEEIEAVVAWALESYPRLVKSGIYSEGTSSRDLIERISLQNSTIRQWMVERVEIKKGAEVAESALFLDFWQYCTGVLKVGIPSMPTFSIDFGSFLGEKGLPQSVNGMYSGIALRPKVVVA